MARIAGGDDMRAPTTDDEVATTASSAVVVFSASVVVFLFGEERPPTADGVVIIAGFEDDGDAPVAEELPPVKLDGTMSEEAAVRSRALFFSATFFAISIRLNLASFSNISWIALGRGAFFLFWPFDDDALSMAAAPHRSTLVLFSMMFYISGRECHDASIYGSRLCIIALVNDAKCSRVQLERRLFICFPYNTARAPIFPL